VRQHTTPVLAEVRRGRERAWLLPQSFLVSGPTIFTLRRGIALVGCGIVVTTSSRSTARPSSLHSVIQDA